MVPPATDRQLDILEAVRQLGIERGFPPTLSELSARLAMKAPGGAASGVKALVAKGLLSVLPRTARSMMVTPAGAEALANRENERQAQGAA